MNKNAQSHHHTMEGLMALLLFGVFAACVLGVLLTGANAYRRLVTRDASAYDRRTCVQYVATRVRQGDGAERVSVEDFGGAHCLTLAQTIDGEEYLTRVYCYDGYLRELFSAAGEPMEPEDGEAVLEADGLELALTDGLLTVTAAQADGTATLLLSLRGGEVGS